MAGSSATPQLNENTVPWQFDGAVTVAGQSLSAKMTAPGPSAFGYQGMTVPLTSATGTAALGTAGAVYLCALYLPQNITLTSMYFAVTTAGTNTHNLLGIYSSAGTQMAYATDLGVISTTGLKTGTLTAPWKVPSAGLYWAAYCSVASAASTVTASAMSSTLVPGVNRTTANYPFAVNGTASTALPASLTLSSSTTTGAFPIWIAVS